MKKLTFDLVTKAGTTKMELEVDYAVCIGFAGRDIEKTKEHIKELAEMGINAGDQIPVIYHVSPDILTQENKMLVIGDGTSGELEFFIVRKGGKTYIGIGSDHTDRELEKVSVTKSKQVCGKAIGTTLWDYEELKCHWDSLELTSWQRINGEEKLYQKGTAADLLVLEELVAAAEKEAPENKEFVAFSGTVPTVAGLWIGENFRGVIEDKVLGRKMELYYEMDVYPNFI